MADVPASVSTLERELRGMFADRLRSLIAYGIHAAEAAQTGTHGTAAHGHEPPLANTLAIVDTLTTADLESCAARVATWHKAGLATPLLLVRHEFERALDAFPLEFGDILADHVVVAGDDPFKGLTVDSADLRRACEVQARSHLLHLREGYLETSGRADALAVLIVRSAAPFAAFLKSVARLEGAATHDGAAAGRHAERALQLDSSVVSDVAKLAGVAEIPSADAVRLFPAYLDAVERLVAYVDGWRAG